MEIVFAYVAGLLTLINPCVLPVLPLVLASALQSHRHAPALLALGMSASFVTLGIGIAALSYSVSWLTQDAITQAGAFLMIGFGAILLVPRFSEAFATATAGFSARADSRFDALDPSGPWGLMAGGALLGAVWSPCIGPTLGGAISLASQGQSLGWATVIMVGFAAGVSTIILALGYGARAAIQKRQAAMRVLAAKARPIMGAVFIAVGVAIHFKVHHMLEIWALDTLPAWFTDLSVSF